MRISLFLVILLFISCKTSQVSKDSNNSREIVEKEEPTEVIDSQFITKQDVFAGLELEIPRFRESENLESLILEKSIPQLQQAVYDGLLSYEDLTLFYLNRIYKYDRDHKRSLNSVISINPKAIEDARAYDLRIDEIRKGEEKFNPYSLMGMPILLKDNINTANMPTTAGAVALKDLQPYTNARVVTNLIEADAVILGKTNMSEWAYFFCGDCPSGYSAIGGQTLNPYGRKKIDAGGSSSGSGVAVAANFAVAAVGTETSGSIISPSSQNSIVGLKPTVGTLSNIGIVPISFYLDTPGPMTKNVVDNAILMNAMTRDANMMSDLFIANLKTATMLGRRIGFFKEDMNDTLYVQAVNDLRKLGADVIELQPRELDISQFITLLNVDMRNDLPSYFTSLGQSQYQDWNVAKIMEINRQDSLRYMPYGQKLFQGIIDEKTYSPQASSELRNKLTMAAQEYLEYYMRSHNLDGFVSVNNHKSAAAALAFFPTLTVPMGYDEDGQPHGLTFMAYSEDEKLLYLWASAYERATQHRKMPKGY